MSIDCDKFVLLTICQLSSQTGEFPAFGGSNEWKWVTHRISVRPRLWWCSPCRTGPLLPCGEAHYLHPYILYLIILRGIRDYAPYNRVGVQITGDFIPLYRRRLGRLGRRRASLSFPAERAHKATADPRPTACPPVGGYFGRGRASVPGSFFFRSSTVFWSVLTCP